MFGIGTRSGDDVVALVDIASGSVGVAVVRTWLAPAVLAFEREDLPLENRSGDALVSAILQSLSSAGEKTLKELSTASGVRRIDTVYCIIGAPWTHSVAGEASSHFEKETLITEGLIGEMAKQSLASQKELEQQDLLEANVVRVLLNGYPTAAPAGKRAEQIRIFTLLSDCKPEMKRQLQEALARLFPNAKIVWRSSARAVLRTADVHASERSLIVSVGGEATDLVLVRKGIMTERMLVPLGMRQIVSAFAEGKPAEETLALLEMLEKEQCDTDACKALEASIAKAEPELVKSFGEAFAKLSSSRKLPDSMILSAPPQLASWLSRFFARIDFTQFTVSTRPFAVSLLKSRGFPDPAWNDPRLSADTGLATAYSLVNIETRS